MKRQVTKKLRSTYGKQLKRLKSRVDWLTKGDEGKKDPILSSHGRGRAEDRACRG